MIDLGEVYSKTEMLYNLDEQPFVTEQSQQHSPIQFSILEDKDLKIYKDFQNWYNTNNMTDNSPNPFFLNIQAHLHPDK